MPQPKIAEEREIMRQLQERRETRSDHKSPDWVAAFWRNLRS